ncbi:MAG: dual specificity protein phosphatase family protein [Pseudanabaenaceae cyanobacterium]
MGAYIDSEHYRQQLVRDGEKRFREWHSRFLAYQQRFLLEMGLRKPLMVKASPQPTVSTLATPVPAMATQPSPATEVPAEPEEPIEQNLWWVVPGRLAGVRKPSAAELPVLQQLGIRAIVSLTDDPGNLDLYAAAGIPHLWLPVKGGTAPTREQLEAFGEFVASQEGGIAVHCSSGRRRTGTFLAAWLVRKGSSAEAAIAAIQTANPAVELREAQIAFLHELAAQR